MIRLSTMVLQHNSVLSSAKNFFKLDKALVKKRVPITQWLPKYKLSTFLRDLLAGFTISLTEIPQAIAFAGVASLPPEYGLYSCILGGVVYAVFGSCKDINVGPTSISAILLQPHVAKFGAGVTPLLCFISGMIVFMLGLLNLGFIIEFFSFPVVAGFTCAASLEIASLQLNHFFGITNGKSETFIKAWQELFERLHDVQLWDTVLAFVSLLLLSFFREIKRFGSLRYNSDYSTTRNVVRIIVFFISLTRNAIIIFVGVGLAYAFRNEPPFVVTGEVHGGFPSFQVPEFSSTKDDTVFEFTEILSGLGASILFIPLIAILETVSIAKSFANGKSVDATQEILAIGLTNLLSSFLGSMPVTGSFSRTAINNASGVKTPLGGIFTTLVTLIAIAFLAPVIYYVPKATMAAVIISAMLYLFEYHAFVALWKNKKLDLIPFLATLICCLTISLEYGILIGLVINLFFVLYSSARPKIIIEHLQVSKYQSSVCVVRPVDNLHYPAADNMRDRILKEVECDIVVIDGECLRTIDITVAKSVVTLSQELEKRGTRHIFWRFKPSITAVCLGLDNSIHAYFKTGELEEIIQDLTDKDV